MQTSLFRFLLLGAVMPLVPGILRAQRATQVVRYSITGVSQGQISGGSPDKTVPGTMSAPPGGFDSPPTSSSASAHSAPVTVNPFTAPSQQGTRTASAAALMTTTPVWQASYQISNNEENKKLSISIDAPMPDGVALTADVGAPQGAAATGPVDLATASKDVVTAIGTGTSGALPIAISVTTPQGVSENSGPRKLTFTFISGS